MRRLKWSWVLVGKRSMMNCDFISFDLFVSLFYTVYVYVYPNPLRIDIFKINCENIT